MNAPTPAAGEQPDLAAVLADLTDDEADDVDRFMGEHMYHHQHVAAVAHMGCDVACRTRALAQAFRQCVLVPRRAALAPVLAAERERARAEALDEVEREIAGAFPLNGELRYDGTPDPQASAYVEGLNAAHDIVRAVRDRGEVSTCTCPHAEVDRGTCVLCGKPFRVGGAV